MQTLNLNGQDFAVAEYADHANHGELGRQRLRLFDTYVRFGRGLRTVIDDWALGYPNLVDERRVAFAAEHPQLEPNALMLRAQAWQLWRAENLDAAEELQIEIQPKIWNEVLAPTEKTTFLAVTNALSNVDMLPYVYRTTHILGEGSGSGTHQFRLLGNLRTAALDQLRARFDGPSSSIHDGYPESFRQKRDEVPRLQICTRRLQYMSAGGDLITWEMTDRGADIDVDYRGLFDGHLNAGNSNVVWDDADFKNFTRHVDAFGEDPGLRMYA